MDGAKAWAAPEIRATLHPALALAKSLARQDALAAILWGPANHSLSQGRAAESIRWAEEMLDTAKATGVSGLLVSGHAHAWLCYCWAGEFTKSVAHAGKVLQGFNDETHHHLADILNHDPKSLAGIYGSISIWMLGYPDRALRLNDEKDAHARRCGHPIDRGWALTSGAHQFDDRCTEGTTRRSTAGRLVCHWFPVWPPHQPRAHTNHHECRWYYPGKVAND